MRRWTNCLVLLVVFCAALLRPLDAAAQVNSSSFGAVTWYNSGANNTYSLDVGDVNNDGYADIVVTNQHYLEDPAHTFTGVGIFINDGAGGFQLTSRYPTDGISGSWQSVKIHDMDGDGKPDLVVLNSGAYNGTCLPPACNPRSVSVMKGNGDGTFQAAVTHLIQNPPNTNLGVGKLVVADVNGDGKPDVIVGDVISYAPFAFVDNFRTAITVLINGGDGTFVSEALYDAGGTAEGEDLIAADVNGDGFQDVLFANECTQSGPTTPAAGNLCVNGNTRLPGTIGVLLGNGDGTFQTAATYASGGIVPGSLATVDLNRDGKLDLLVTNGGCFQCQGNATSVLIGNGDGSFQPPVNYNNGGFAVGPVSVTSGDVDGDGLTDAAVLSFCGAGGDCAGAFSVLPGNGDGTFQAPAVFLWFTSNLGINPNTVVLADVNNDGKPDAVLLGWTAVGVMLNQTPRAATTTAVLSQANPAGLGQTVTFTATVSSSSPGTPSGTVTFSDGATTLGSSPLVGGVATFSTSSLALGAHTIRASYSSDSSFRASVSSSITQLVEAATSTAITSSANPSAEGQSVTFTATVTAQPAGAVAGSVTFKDGAVVLGSTALSGNSADFSTSSLSAGAHTITAVYGGDASHVGSTSPTLNEAITAVPVITWNPPATVVTGTPLSSLQLNATANVLGTFTYAPTFGTVLALGAHTLTAAFTPADPTHYAATQAQVTIEVVPTGPSGPTAFYGVGDLPGGPSISFVLDATRAGGAIYAVGASAAHFQTLCNGPNNPPGCVTQFNADTSSLWTWDGTAGSLTALPDLVSPTIPGVSGITAGAITRDGKYIASQARSSVTSSGLTQAARITRDTLSILNLGAAPFPALPSPAAAGAVSEDGSIVYALAGSPTRAVRIDVNASSSTPIPLLSVSDTGNLVARRGISFDGSVAVGTSFVFPLTNSNGRAFRYVHGAADVVSAIPLLAGGTWNRASAVSPDGRFVLGEGNSTFLPNGEMFLYDAVSGTTTALGSPNTPWAPLNQAGMTADGSVVVATFADATTPNGNRSAYMHNAHGWFHITTVLASQGIDITTSDWNDEGLQVVGISPDGTLVFGQGPHNGNTEGFVAEFPPGLLAAFDVPAMPPISTSLVGVWKAPGAGQEVVVFLNDGTYFHIDTSHGAQTAGENSAGFERGRYTWDGTHLTFATLQDTNGDVGLSGGNGILGLTGTLSGDTFTVGTDVFTRATGPAGSVVGGWVFGDPRVDNDSAVLVLLDDGTFMFAKDGDSAASPSGHDGVEGGTYTRDASGLTTINVTVDTNGGWGFGDGPGTHTVTLLLSPDELHLQEVETGGSDEATRIVDPQTVVPVVTSALTAAGQVGSLFNYTVTATHAASFDATGLPNGLAIDPATGIISGVPTFSGMFRATIFATNSFGSTGSAQLVITVAPQFIATALNASPASGTFGGTTTVSATLTGGGSPLAGESIVFSLNGTVVGSATTNAAGVATLVGASLAGIGANTYAAGVQAAFAGGATYASSSGSAALTVGKAIPVVSWATPGSIAHGTALGASQLNATANVPGTFAYTPPAGTILPIGVGQTLSVLFTPTDATDYTTAQAQVAITVNDNAPVAQNGAVTTNEDTPVSGTLSGSDVDGDALTFTIVTPGQGTVVIDNPATGAFTYTPAANRFGHDSFTFQASDGQQTSNVATMSVTINPVNDAPIAGDSTLAVVEDTPTTGFFSGSDIDSLLVTFAVVTPPAHGTVSILNPVGSPFGTSFIYTPNADYNGPDSFTFHITDGGLTSNTATVSLTVTPVNDPPVARNVVVTTQEGTSTTGSLAATDVDGDGLTFSLVTPPTKGTFVLLDAATGAFTYTPNAGAVGYDTFTFRAADPTGASSTANGLVFIVAAAPRWPGQTIRAGVSTTGVQPSGSDLQETFPPALSADGRYIAYSSLAPNVVAGDTNGQFDVFVLDRNSGVVTRASVSSAGVQGNSGSGAVRSISADGRFVAFSSSATNLVAGDTNGVQDIFVRDLQTGATTRVSVASDGTQGNADSSGSWISADGRFVAFVSTASNLAPGGANGRNNVFVHDLQTGQTIRASVASDGTNPNGDSDQPVMSADGRFIAFRSSASNLVVGDTNGAFDVFVRDVQAGTTTRVSVASDGTQANNASLNPVVSADGRFVAFFSSASNLVSDDTNGTGDVFLHDMQTDQTTRASLADGGTQADIGGNGPALSADGRYVAFQSSASNLVPSDTNSTQDVFVYDRQTAVTTRVSVGNDGAQSNGFSSMPAFSADGRYIGFFSQASNFVPSDTNNQADLFVVGGVFVSPTALNIPTGGGSRNVGVAFDYPGTPWSSSTTTPWITINAPSGGSTSGTLSFTATANTGAARTGTLTVALQTITVTQDAFVDVTPPTVTAPAPITVYATVPTGATPATVPALAAFLAAATATDDGPAAPTAQPPTLNGIAVGGGTIFALGTNIVTFTFTDSVGHIGTATSAVTVLAGRPSLSVSLVNVTVAGSGQQTVTLRLTNTGAGNALNLNVAASSIRTLTGTGAVTVASGLPANSPALGPGQSLTLPVLMNMPPTVLRFSLSLALAMTDSTGAALSSASTLAIFPIDVTSPTVINNGPIPTTIGRVSITLTWQTSEAATGGVAYGFNTSTNLTIPDDGVYATSHTATITGLVPNTDFSVIVFGHDPAGNIYTSVRKVIHTLP